MLTQDHLKSILEYNQKDGNFRWKLLPTINQIKVGDIAGSVDVRGYVHIGIEGKIYYAHRLAFLYMTGSLPEKEVDHKNQNKTDNSWENLRECNRSQNGANIGKQRNNKSGYKGVSLHKTTGKWKSQISINGKNTYLGIFSDKLEAVAVYNKKHKEIHNEFAHFN